MHDHSKPAKRFCPLMKEWCIKGWTPAMGKGEDGFPIESACVAWQPVSSFDRKKNQVLEIHDCSAFAWGPDLLAEIATEVSHGTASTDKVANEVDRHRKSFIGALPPSLKAEALLLEAAPEEPHAP